MRNLTATLTGEHADRALRALLDHLAESFDAAADNARRAARGDANAPDLDVLNVRDHAREAAGLLDTVELFRPSSSKPLRRRARASRGSKRRRRASPQPPGDDASWLPH